MRKNSLKYLLSDVKNGHKNVSIIRYSPVQYDIFVFSALSYDNYTYTESNNKAVIPVSQIPISSCLALSILLLKHILRKFIPAFLPFAAIFG